MTKSETIKCIMQQMFSLLDNYQLKTLQTVLNEVIQNEKPMTQDLNYAELFISAKRIEGCSEKTLSYYNSTISHMRNAIGKSPMHITTEDLREYLLNYQSENGSSKITIDNIRRILSKETSISIIKYDETDYISLTDIARFKTSEPNAVIGNWMRNRNTIEYLGIWETLYNPAFKPIEFEGFKKIHCVL